MSAMRTTCERLNHYMTKEERKAYDLEYRLKGFRKEANRRYRLRHLLELRAKDRARKAKPGGSQLQK